MAGSTFLSSPEFACRTLPNVRAIAFIRTTATAHSQTSPRNRGCSKRAGPAECVSVTTTTTGSRICLSPTGDITSSTVTMAMALFQSYPNRLASLDRPIGGVQAALLWITTATDIWICLYPTTLNSSWKRLRNPVRRRTASILLLRCFVAPGDIPTVSTVYTAITAMALSLTSVVAAVRTSYGFTAIAADFDDDGWPG